MSDALEVYSFGGFGQFATRQFATWNFSVSSRHDNSRHDCLQNHIFIKNFPNDTIFWPVEKHCFANKLTKFEPNVWAFFKNKLNHKHFSHWFENLFLIFQPKMHSYWIKFSLICLQCTASQCAKNLCDSDNFWQIYDPASSRVANCRVANWRKNSMSRTVVSRSVIQSKMRWLWQWYFISSSFW